MFASNLSLDGFHGDITSDAELGLLAFIEVVKKLVLNFLDEVPLCNHFSGVIITDGCEKG